MRAHLWRISALALLCFALIAAGPKRVMVEIYVYDLETQDFINHASITVDYVFDHQHYELTHFSHGRFAVPTSVTSINVTVDEPGYCQTYPTAAPTPFDIDGRSHVGGQAFYVGLEPCEAPRRAALR